MSILLLSIHVPLSQASSDVRLTLEVLHNIKEPVIDIGLVVELNFDLIEVCEGILEQDLLAFDLSYRWLNMVKWMCGTM